MFSLFTKNYKYFVPKSNRFFDSNLEYFSSNDHFVSACTDFTYTFLINNQLSDYNFICIYLYFYTSSYNDSYIVPIIIRKQRIANYKEFRNSLIHLKEKSNISNFCLHVSLRSCLNRRLSKI